MSCFFAKAKMEFKSVSRPSTCQQTCGEIHREEVVALDPEKEMSTLGTDYAEWLAVDHRLTNTQHGSYCSIPRLFFDSEWRTNYLRTYAVIMI